jgi:hypothetical protein
MNSTEDNSSYFSQVATDGTYVLYGHTLSEGAASSTWIGYLLAVSDGAGETMSLQESWYNYANDGASDIGGTYVFYNTEPSDFDQAIADTLSALEQLNPDSQQTDRYFLWQDEQVDSAGSSATTLIGNIPFTGPEAETGGSGSTTKMASLDLLQLQMQLDSEVEVQLDGTQFTFSQGGTTNKYLRILDRYNQVSDFATPDDISISMADDDAATLNFDGIFMEGILDTPIGFQYGLQPDSTTTGFEATNMYYPLLNDSIGLYYKPFSAQWSLFEPLDSSATNWSLIYSSGPVDSSFRTVLGNVIRLEPTSAGSSQLTFNINQDGHYYLTPSGNFTIVIEDEATTTSILANKLLCGLSGVEYLSFEPGDYLRFIPAQNAAVLVLEGDDSYNFIFDETDSGAQTAYATIIPQSGGEESKYYSEPEQAPFFSEQGDYSLQLEYFELTRSSLPNDESFPGVPMVPYARLSTQEIEDDADLVRNLEFQLYNPTRNQTIEDYSDASDSKQLTFTDNSTPTKSDSSESTSSMSSMMSSAASSATVSAVSSEESTVTTALTPQGYISTFDTGAWSKLQIANKQTDETQVSIDFTPVDGATGIPGALQDAFLTNQQFLVITKADNLGTFAPTVNMTDWPFLLDPSVNTMIGDYRNVILFKSSSGSSFNELVKQPQIWTRYSDFNDASSDPLGLFISQWLQEYFADAVTMYDDGEGVESLADFIQIINDPLWNGFLSLKVDVETSSLPLEIEALLAGIDKSLFYGHHLGVEINHVSPPEEGGSDYDLNSSVFGLVHYLDPNIADVNNIPAFYSSPSDYDFTVLTLEAIFEQGVLVNFSNKSMLLINKYFGDTVLELSADGDNGANNLILLGTYSDQNGAASYTFATAKGETTEFYLSSNALYKIPITRATMTVQETGTTDAGLTTYLSRFGLWGNMVTLGYEDFDLLSYQLLGFSNLIIDMVFDNGDTDPVFDFSSKNIALSLNQNKIYDESSDQAAGGFNLVRAGSLLSQFPLELKAMYQGTSGSQPKDLGYITLKSEDPTGINTADLSGGNWYALQFIINLGGQGTMASDAGLSADIFVAWTPGGDSQEAVVTPSFKLSGPGGVSLSFDLEGVLKFGAQDIVLNRPTTTEGEVPQFIMIFQSLGLSVLGKSFPPLGTTNVTLFGDTTDQSSGIVNPTLGWFGGYVAEEANT